MPIGAFKLNGIARYLAPTSSTRSSMLIVPFNNATTSTAQFKFGTASLLLDGNDDYVTATTVASDSSGALTLEAWVRFNSLPSSQTLGGGNYMMLATISSSSYVMIQDSKIQVAVAGAYYGFTIPTVSINTWYHIAVVRESNNDWFVYWNGTKYTGTVDAGDTDVNKSGNWFADGSMIIGRFIDVRGSWSGYIDEFRLSNTARYTATFTPSASAFSNDSNTKLLAHFDGNLYDDSGTTWSASYGTSFAGYNIWWQQAAAHGLGNNNNLVVSMLNHTDTGSTVDQLVATTFNMDTGLVSANGTSTTWTGPGGGTVRTNSLATYGQYGLTNHSRRVSTTNTNGFYGFSISNYSTTNDSTAPTISLSTVYEPALNVQGDWAQLVGSTGANRFLTVSNNTSNRLTARVVNSTTGGTPTNAFVASDATYSNVEADFCSFDTTTNSTGIVTSRETPLATYFIHSTSTAQTRYRITSATSVANSFNRICKVKDASGDWRAVEFWQESSTFYCRGITVTNWGTAGSVNPTVAVSTKTSISALTNDTVDIVKGAVDGECYIVYASGTGVYIKKISYTGSTNTPVIDSAWTQIGTLGFSVGRATWTSYYNATLKKMVIVGFIGDGSNNVTPSFFTYS